MGRLAFVVWIVILSVGAAEAADVAFMGATVIPAPGTYVAEQDINLRSAPNKDGRRVGKLDAGEMATAVGKAKGTSWLAITKNGKPFGFVYAPAMTPILDGTLDNDVTGDLRVEPNLRCGYRISFVGRSEVEAQVFKVSDYDATIVCERVGKRLRLPAQMFMTEAPLDVKDKTRKFQINVDLLDGLHGLDDIFSTSMVFDLDEGQVRFDRANEQSYIKPKLDPASLPATDVARALGSAMNIALSAWSDKAWNDIYSHAK